MLFACLIIPNFVSIAHISASHIFFISIKYFVLTIASIIV